MYLFYYIQVTELLSILLVQYKHPKNISVKKVLNNEHFLIIHGQSLIILSQSVSVNICSGNLIVLCSFI